MPDEQYLHPTYTFPGVEYPKACQYTRSLGITPGQATLTLAPQDGFVSQIGTLKLTYGDQEIEVKRVRCDAATLRKSPTDPRLWELTAFDRRWKWAYGDTGRIKYNVRDGDGAVIAATQKTPQQLATLLFSYMGETDYSVSALPLQNDDGDDFYPEFSWDHDVPAEKLAELLEMCGCDVSLDLDDSVTVVRLGVGTALPLGNIISKSKTIDLPEPVHEVVALAARSQYQADILLFAVGLDTDGAVKLLVNLTYAPAGGWSSICAPDTWHDILESVVLPDGRTIKPRETYQKTVYKWYQLPDTFNVPGLGIALSRDDLMPLIEEQVDTTTESGGKVRKPAEVYGVVRKYFNGGYGNTAADTLCETNFSLDTENGIVKFSDYVYQYGNVDDPANKTNLPATLELRCSFQGERQGVSAELSADTTLPTKTLTTDEVAYFYKDGLPVNALTVATVLLYLAQQYISKVERLTIQERTYSGLREIDTDGLVRQVSWQCSTDAAATTSASQNSETVDPSVMPEKVRRVYEKLRGMLK